MVAPGSKWRWIAPLFVLALHAAVAFHAATRLAPTWDEIAYPAAGLSQLTTGQIRLNTVNPYLSKLIYALPILPWRAYLPVSHPSWEAADEYGFGFHFTYRSVPDFRRVIVASRIPAVLFSVATGFLLFLWLSRLWGFGGGMIALVSYATTPIFLSRASVAQLEMPVYFFVVAALWLHSRWLDDRRLAFLVGTGVLLGMALLSKLIALPAVAAVAALSFLARDARGLRPRLVESGSIIAMAVAVFVVGYLPWKNGIAALGHAAYNLVSFDKIIPYYWAGQTRAETGPLVSLAAFIIKAPIPILILGGWGAVVWIRSGRAVRRLGIFLGMVFLSVLSVVAVDNAVSTIQMSPAYLGIVALTAPLVRFLSVKRAGFAVLLIGLLVFNAVDVARVHPNYLGYFNFLVGGPDNGYRWLADSDQDWGQSLPALADFMRDRGVSSIVLSYSGAGDPAAYGIAYRDFLSPALVTKDERAETPPDDVGPIYFAVGTKVWQSERGYFGWLRRNREPDHIVGQSYLVFDFSDDPEALRWVAGVYLATGRRESARWAMQRADRIAPADPNVKAGSRAVTSPSPS